MKHSPFVPRAWGAALREVMRLALLPALVLGLATLGAPGPATAATAATAKAKTACRDCHEKLAAKVPQGHKVVKGDTLRACSGCHEPDATAPADTNAYSARLHRAHAQGEGRLDCAFCHRLQPLGKFALVGDKVTLPATPQQMKRLQEVSLAWAGGKQLDAAHGRADVDCRGCHGTTLPDEDAEVANARCLACHGPLDRLVAKTAPADFADRNPHHSHLGEIACTVCHQVHQPGSVYCLDCHRKFEMKLPDGSRH